MSNFIQDFVKANEGNECPRDYIMWSAYSAISVAIGRRVFLDMKHFLVNCNIYVCLVGPAGNRKTFARDKAFDLIVEVLPDAVISAECETRQGITKFMGAPEQQRTFTDHNGVLVEYRPYALFAGELMNYLSLDPGGMITFLTDIFDRPFYKYRLKNEEHILPKPYFVMLACTVPDWLTRQIRSDEFCSGFGRRTIFVCDDSDIRMKPTITAEQLEAQARCKKRLKEITEIVGEFKLTPEADKWFWQEFYPNHKLSDNKFMRSWGRSKHIQMLKLAMLNSLADSGTNKNNLVITKENLEFTEAILENVERRIPMITDLMGRSEIAVPAMHVLSVLKNHGGCMPKKELLVKTFSEFKDSREQWSTLEHLKATDQIIEILSDKVAQLKEMNPEPRMYYILPGKIRKV